MFGVTDKFSIQYYSPVSDGPDGTDTEVQAYVDGVPVSTGIDCNLVAYAGELQNRLNVLAIRCCDSVVVKSLFSSTSKLRHALRSYWVASAASAVCGTGTVVGYPYVLAVAAPISFISITSSVCQDSDYAEQNLCDFFVCKLTAAAFFFTAGWAAAVDLSGSA